MLSLQGVRGCLFAGNLGTDSDADDAEWLYGAGAWYPSLHHMPPSVARQLGLTSGYVSDAGFAAIGASLTSEVAVADSAVVRIDGPLVWHTRQRFPQSLDAIPASSTGRSNSLIHSVGSASLDLQTARALELYALTSGVSSSAGVIAHAKVGGSGQLRGITIRNVRPVTPHCLVVVGPGPVVLLATPLSAHALSNPSTLSASEPVTDSIVNTVPAPSTAMNFSGIPRKSSYSFIELALPLQVVQCDLGNRGGSGACVVANAGASMLMLACRIASGSGSGLLVQVCLESEIAVTIITGLNIFTLLISRYFVERLLLRAQPLYDSG